MSEREVLDHPFVSSHYFFPRPVPPPDPHWVRAHDGSRLACHYQEVDSDAKTVVYFHGNGEVVADYLPEFSGWLNRAGFNVLLAEYRGYGGSTGRPALAAMLEDVDPIIRSVNRPDDQIVLFGRSLGSLYALHGAYRRPQIAGLILESGVAEIGERFFLRVRPEELGVSEAEILRELHRHFDYRQKLRAFNGPTLVMHTRHDELIPSRHADLLYAAAQEPKQLEIFEQGGHNDIFFRNRERYMKLVESFLAGL